MSKSFLAMITPLEGGASGGLPSHPIVIPPDAVGPGVPTHPIYLPPYPDNALPGAQPRPDHGLPKPPPTVTPPRPDQGLPAFPSHPIVYPPGLPVSPEHPIALPPTPGLPPLVPTNPIVLPERPPADAVVILLNTKMAPPPGAPQGSQPAILWYGPGTLPMFVWAPPPATPK